MSAVGPREGNAAPPAARITAQFTFELRLLLRNGENLLAALVIPVAVLVFFSLVPVLPTGGERPVDFLVPGVLALAVTAAGVLALGISTAFERQYYVLKRLGATPLRRHELVVAKLLAVIGVQVIQLVAVVTAAVLLGWQPTVTAGGLTAGFTAWLLGTAACCGLGLAMAGRLPALAALALSNGLFLLLLLCSGIVFPLEELPTFLRVGAELLPVAPMAEVLRAVFAAEPLGNVVRDLIVLAVWAVGAPVFAAKVFRWE